MSKVLFSTSLWIMAGFVLSLSAVAQEISLQNGQTDPILLHRFESPISPDPAFEKLRRPLAELRYERDRAAFAIRVCSENKLLLAFPSAVVDPSQIVEFIRSRYADRSSVPKIFLLRSTSCKSAQTAVEVWAIRKKGKLPDYIENYEIDQLDVQQLGFDPSICSTSKKDSKKATQSLIEKLRNDPNSFGVIIGYIDAADTYPNKELRRRIENSQKLMEKSGVSKGRYAVTYEIWHADDSECSTQPVTKPSIFFLTVKPPGQKRNVY